MGSLTGNPENTRGTIAGISLPESLYSYCITTSLLGLFLFEVGLESFHRRTVNMSICRTSKSESRGRSGHVAGEARNKVLQTKGL